MRRRERCSNEQILQYAEEYVTTELTIRDLSIAHCVARSTLHRYLIHILPTLDVALAERVREVAKCKKYEGECKGGRNRFKRKEKRK